MKKIALITIISFIAIFSYAQKIQIKKGIITKDDVVIGKLEGKATLLNGTDVSILSNESTPLITIKDPLVKSGYPFHEPIRYYSIKFVSLNKTAALIPENKKFFTSEKKLVEYLFEQIGSDFLTKDGLNTTVIDKFIAEKDQSKKINDDTLAIAKYVKIGKEKLNDPLISRPEKGEIRLKSIQKETISTIWSETFQTFEIYQGGVVIGKITKLYKGDPSASTSTTPQSKQTHYIVTRKVNPFSIDGKNIEYIDLASIKSSVSGPDVFTDCGKVGLQGLKVSDIYSAEYDIVSWLVSKGCL